MMARGSERAERLKALTPGELSADAQALYDEVVAARGGAAVAPDGSLLGPLNVMLHNPTVGGPLLELGTAVRFRGSLPPRARELAILVVADRWECDLEWQAHAASALDLGVAPAQLEAIQRGAEVVSEDRAEQAAVSVARAQLAAASLDDDAYERARRALTVGGLVEVTTLVGYYATVVAQLRLFGVSAPDEYHDVRRRS